MSTYVKQGGSWDLIDFAGVHFKAAGDWFVAQKLYFKLAGVWTEVWRANGPPPDPTDVTAVASNGGAALVSWTYPTNLENDYGEVRVEEQLNGGAWTGANATAYPGTSQVRSGLVHGGSYKFRAATRDTSTLDSAWVESNTVSGLNVAPSAATSLSVTWDGANDRFILSWTDPGNPHSDITDVDVYAKYSDEGSYTKVADLSYAGGARSTGVTRRAWDKLHSFYVRVISPGGTTDSAVVTMWSPPQPGTIKYVSANDSRTYSVGRGAWKTDDNPTNPHMGYFSSNYGKQAGYLFYGTGLYDACHGHTPVSAQVHMIRNGSFGFSGKLDFYWHSYTAQGAGVPPTFHSGTYWESVNTFFGSDDYWEDIPSGHLAAVANGTYKGILIWRDTTNTNSYRHMLGPAADGTAGQIKLVF